MQAGMFVNYTKKGKGFSARLFLGKHFYNDSNNPRYNWRMDGQNGFTDYMYDQLYLGRNENSGFLSQQFVENEGGFKVPTAVGQSHDWILAMNLKFEAPIPVPFGIYADVGANPKEELLSSGIREIVVKWNYDVGIYIWLIRGAFEVYFPFIYSNEIQAAYAANGIEYGETIRFKFNLNLANPLRAVRSFKF